MFTFLALLALLKAPPTEAHAPRPWWDAQVAASLARAPGKRADWEKALAATVPEQRDGMAYLVAWLPLPDLASLPPEALLKNVALAYKARDLVPWGGKIPRDVFFDAVLPHCSLTEPHDSMRAEFLDKYLALVKGCKTPGAAACRIIHN